MSRVQEHFSGQVPCGVYVGLTPALSGGPLVKLNSMELDGEK